MSWGFRCHDPRIDEYWSWFGGSLFLLFPIDLLTTYGAAARTGLQYEINPIMRWLLAQQIPVVIGVHLTALIWAAITFDIILRLIHRGPALIQRIAVFGLELWIGLLLTLGLFIYANNLAVIVLGLSLL